MLLLYPSGDVAIGRPIGLAKAVERIVRWLHISTDRAVDRLVEVAATGQVRSTGVSPFWGHRRGPITIYWRPRSVPAPTVCNLQNDSISNLGDGTITRVEFDSGDLENWLRGEAEQRSSSGFKSASEAQIRKVIDTIYNGTDRAGAKPPNLNELAARVKNLLQQEGHDASYRHIQELAKESAPRRLKRGQRPLTKRSPANKPSI